MTVLPVGDWYDPHEIELPRDDWGISPEHHQQKQAEQTVSADSIPTEAAKAAKLAEVLEDMELLDWSDYHVTDGVFLAPEVGVSANMGPVFLNFDVDAGRAQGTRAWTTLGKDPFNFVNVGDLPGYDPDLFLEWETDAVLITGIEGIAYVNGDGYHSDPSTFHSGLFGTLRLTRPEVTWSPDFMSITADPAEPLTTVVMRPVIGYDPPGGLIVRPADPNEGSLVPDFPWMDFVTEDQRTFAVGQYIESYEMPATASRQFGMTSFSMIISHMTLELPAYRWVGLEIGGDAEEVRRAFT